VSAGLDDENNDCMARLTGSQGTGKITYKNDRHCKAAKMITTVYGMNCEKMVAVIKIQGGTL
jgi:hypothetical protein